MGRLLDRIRNRPKAPGVKDLIGKGLDIVDEAVTDKDALNKLKYTLAQAQAQLMLGGSGFPITKYTICGLVSLVVGIGAYVFLRAIDFIITSEMTQESLEMAKVLMSNYRDFSMPALAAIGLITGGFVTGTSFKRSKWSKDE